MSDVTTCKTIDISNARHLELPLTVGQNALSTIHSPVAPVPLFLYLQY